jgi:hypothetical protein
VLIGTVDKLIEGFHARRERWGISYYVIFEPYVDAFAPVVTKCSLTPPTVANGAQQVAMKSRLRQLSSSAVRFACDSPLEGDGFELPVPRHKSREFPQHSGRRLLF